MLLALMPLACVPPEDDDPVDSGWFDWHDTDVDEVPGDSEDSAEDTGQVEHEEYDFLFVPDRVVPIDLEISDESLEALRDFPREYATADIVIDGERLDGVGVKLKGSSSFRRLRDKAAFKIDFNRYLEDQEFHGLTKLTLNNMLNDETQLHEVLAHAAFAAAGLPHSRVGYAWVRVNGEDFGLYANVETPARPWIERHFGTKEGNLYEGGYPYYPDSWDHADFTSDEARNFELESGTDVANADTVGVASAVADRGDDWDATVGALVDLEQYVRFQIAEVWVGQWDGYALASNNYRVYFPADASAMQMVPAGLDWTFTDYGSDWKTAYAPLGAGCQRDETCDLRFGPAAVEVCDAIDAAALTTLLDAASELIEPYVEEDPRREVTPATVRGAQDDVREWIDGRSEKVLRWYPE